MRALNSPQNYSGILFLISVLLFSCGGPDTRNVIDEPYESYAPFNRGEVSGRNAAVVSGHPLATRAGQEVLRNGGNAVDAAVTMAAALTVLRPHMNGVGGDAFGIFYDDETGEVTAINGSGRSGELATPEFFETAGEDEIPMEGALAVTVPGAVSAWYNALEAYGTISFADALQPAIEYADEGFPVTPTLVRDFENVTEELNQAGQDIFMPDGAPLQEGEILRNPALAQTLQMLADEGPSAIYGGTIGQHLADFIEQEGGYLRTEDFENHSADWVDPLQSEFFGKNVYAFPPNTQAIALPMQLAMSEHVDLEDMGHNSTDYLHHLIEIKKLAFADRNRWIADPEFEDIPVDELLDHTYLQNRANEIGSVAAREVAPGFGDEITHEVAEGDGDTVYLMAVDEDGNAVSWIQSIFSSFGSKLVEPETGLVLQNRGAGFTLSEDHPNRLKPNKRPFHTLSSSLITDAAGNFRAITGTPGGDGQTQFKVQVLHNLFTFDMSPQKAVEAPRFRSYEGTDVAMESRILPAIRMGLRNRNHELDIYEGWTPVFGGMQIIMKDPDTGVLRTGADPRREAAALAY